MPAAAKRAVVVSLGDRIKSPFRALSQFLTEVWFEMKRVVWPSREEAQSFTAVVIIAVGIVALWVGSLDWIATTVVSALKLYSNR
jgi:preprotein translocase SecE subunit